MFSKAIVSTTLLALAAAVAATFPASECNTGDLQCCNSTTNTVTPAVTALMGLLGISASSIAIPIGLTCDPITVIGLGKGASCSAQPVCCSDNNYNGLIAFGCIPVDLSL